MGVEFNQKSLESFRDPKGKFQLRTPLLLRDILPCWLWPRTNGAVLRSHSFPMVPRASPKLISRCSLHIPSPSSPSNSATLKALANMSFLIFLSVITVLQCTFAGPLSSGEGGDENLFLNSDVSSLPSDDSSFLFSDDPTLWPANPDDPSPNNQLSLGDVGSDILDGTGTESVGWAGVGDFCAADGNTPSLAAGKMRARDEGSSCTNSDANVNLLKVPNWDTVRDKFKNLLNPQLDGTPPPPAIPPQEEGLRCESNFPEHLCCQATDGSSTTDWTASFKIYHNMGGCTRTVIYGFCPLWEVCCRSYSLRTGAGETCFELKNPLWPQ